MAEIKPPPDAHLDAMLDDALAESFPASDPPSMLQPRDFEYAPGDSVRG